MRALRSRTPPPVAMFVSLAALELLALASLLAIHRKGDRTLFAFATRPPGIVLLVSLLGVVATLSLILALLRTAPSAERRGLWVGAAANLLSVSVAFAAVEIGVRALAKSRPGAATFAGIALLPRSWEEVAEQGRTVLARANDRSSFLIADDSLGWTVGPSRSSADYNRKYIEAYFPELARRYPRDYPDLPYASSVEGIRSATVGETFSGTSARHRVAAVGDSFTFGLEVPFEHTWTHQLERQLGEGAQVLNFGVDGYGVDQSLLRYQRDVAPWKPDVVILGVINDDLRRSMGVYGFLTFPGSEIPFAKPRFVLEDGRLRALNQPLPEAASIFAQPAIADLPFVEYDRGYDASEWRSRFYDRSFAVRLLFALYPRWRPPPPAGEVESLNHALFRAFVASARAHAATPLVVVLPTQADFAEDTSRQPRPLADLLDGDSSIPHVDMLDCLRALPADDRFLALHYSATANDAIASCLKDAVSQALADEGAARGARAGGPIAHR